ncbi:MAG: response regulator [Burkholderiaceae bacterium]
MVFKQRDPRRRILIVEDDWAILEVLKLMLEHEGHVVVTAKHGREAVDLAAAKPFDMVLMDISMPEMSGIEVARVLRDNERTADVLIGIHTGLDEHWVRERFDDYDLFLTKATDTDVLVDEIARLFAQPKATRERRVAEAEAQTFSSEELARARDALRNAMGIGSEALSTQAFIALLGDEIDQLRKVGRSDVEIAALIGGAIDRDVAPAFIRQLTS